MLNLEGEREVFYTDASNKMQSVTGIVTINNDIIIIKSNNKDKFREMILFKERVINIQRY